MTETMLHQLVAPEPGRLDRMLQAALPAYSRSRLQQLIAAGECRVNGIVAEDAARKVKIGDAIDLRIPAAVPVAIRAQEMPITILFEDAHLLVIDKPAGLTVHPGAGNPDGTLVNALLAHCGDTLSGIGGEMRPGIVHRLDKETSGLMVVAKHDVAHRRLSAQLADRSLGRVYIAYAWGSPKRLEGEVETQIGRSPRDRKKMAVLKSGGRDALTRYRTCKLFSAETNGRPFAAKMECRLATGRTHQIRVHLAHLGLPLIGDPVYGVRAAHKLSPLEGALGEAATQAIETFNRQALHAAEIHFRHPATHESLSFTSPLPEDLQALEKALSAAPQL